MITIILISFSSFVISYVLSHLLLNYVKIDLIDKPGKRRIHKTPMPLIGGIIIYLVMTLLLAITNLTEPYTKFILFGLMLFFLVGLLDDYLDLSSLYKFSFPAIFSILCSYIYTYFYLPNSDFLIFLLISFAIFFTVNAFNLVDGMDGLCISISTFSFFTFAIFCFFQSLDLLFLVSLIIFFSLIALFIFNKPPAKYFLGDSGTHQLGFLVASICLKIFMTENSGKNITEYIINDSDLIIFLIMVLGYPMFDAVYTPSYRLYHKKRPWVGDMNHPYHKLRLLGYNNFQILIFINIIHIIMISLALMFFFYSNLFYPFILVILLLCVAKFLGRAEFDELERIIETEK